MFFSKPAYNVRLIYYIILFLIITFSIIYPMHRKYDDDGTSFSNLFKSTDSTPIPLFGAITRAIIILAGCSIGIIGLYFFGKYLITNSKNI